MTREEQIEEFANSQIDCEFFDDSLYKGIIIGAKWADDNQPCMAKIQKDYELLFIFKKDELINKASKWLEKNKDNYIVDIEGKTIIDSSIIKDICKVMRE